jgi:hypothetical protein
MRAAVGRRRECSETACVTIGWRTLFGAKVLVRGEWGEYLQQAIGTGHTRSARPITSIGACHT